MPTACQRRAASSAALLLVLAWSGTAGCAAQGRDKGRLQALAGVDEAAIEAQLKGQRIALLIGVDRFDDPAWHGLRFAGRDAAELAGFLSSPEGGRFDQVLLVDQPAQTDLAGVRGALGRLAALSTRPQDTVVIYVSSHGTLARDGRGALRRYVVLRSTTAADVPASALPVDELLAELERLPSRRKLAVLAFCHSGHGKSAMSERLRDELARTKGAFFAEPLEQVSEATLVLSASAWGETAREDDGLRHDIYTHFLLEALRQGYDLDGDGAVTASEAHDYARQRTYEFSGGQQRPTAMASILGVDPIVLAGERTRTGGALLLSFDRALDGVAVSVNGRPKGLLPGVVPLPPGRVSLTFSRAGLTLLERPISVTGGEQLDAGQLVARALSPAWRLTLQPAAVGAVASQRRPLFAGIGPGLDLLLSRERWLPFSIGLALLASGYGADEQIAGQWWSQRVYLLAPRLVASWPALRSPEHELHLGLEAGRLLFGRSGLRPLELGEQGQDLRVAEGLVSPLVGPRLEARLALGESLALSLAGRAGYFLARIAPSDDPSPLTVHALQLGLGLGLAWQAW